MANVAANAIDWYVNKLNTMHLIPANVATLIRDVSSKQLGDPSFEPRPLTVDNFTDAELDALHALSSDGKGGYRKHFNNPTYDEVSKKWFEYGDGNRGSAEYFSPLRTVSTTIGAAHIRRDRKGVPHIVDKYDFNIDEPEYIKDPSGDGIIDAYGTRFRNVEEMKRTYSGYRGKSLYGRVRRNAGKFGHNSRDPDKGKIKTDISIQDIKDRLGDRLGKHDILKPANKKDFVVRTALGGGLIGAPIGAGMGALTGLILLLNKEKRKKWKRTLLSHIGIGALAAAAIGAAGGGYAAHKAYDALDKKDMTKSSSDKRREREEKRRRINRLISLIAYAAPFAAMGGIAIPIVNKAKNAINGITDINQEVGNLIDTKEVDEDRTWEFMQNIPGQV